ncbi:unnamed protein product [Rotaria sordida]|uniref:Uncharacterized protein n=1 Tax=Rotaria sordida TaxID=392033 RepID=A0A813SHD2_9BILA|nr:unnamed protein product [Rotaria sordida]
MSFTTCIMFLLIFSNWVIAEDIENEGMNYILIISQVFLIIGITVAFVIIIISSVIFAYFTLKFITTQTTEPQYYINDTSIDKDSNTYHNEYNDTSFEIQYLYQIRPILTVSHVISSIKQSFTYLYYSLIPSKWLPTQHTNNQQSPDDIKMDLPI